MTAPDIDTIADTISALAARLQRQGDLALTRAEGWIPGPQPGDRHDTPPQPGDPDYTEPAPGVGPDATITDQQRDDRESADKAARTYHRLVATLTQLEHEARAANRLLDTVLVTPPGTARPEAPADYVAAGGCRSCARAREFEPIAVHADGTPRYRDLCYWCAKYRHLDPDTDAEHPQPPLALVRWRHRNPGRNVTTKILTQMGIHHDTETSR